MTGPDGSATPGAQIAAVTAASAEIARLVAAGHEVVVTHGNGPQVGNLLVKNELAAAVVPPVPLDWCGAQTQGTLGFILLDALEPALAAVGSAVRPAALVSRTLVALDDPGFARPTKPIGRHLPAEEAQVLIGHGETWEDRGEKGWRRVVASPQPIEVLEGPAIRALLDAGLMVIAGGGGGIPVVRDADGSLRGVEAVIDKDLSAVVLARAVSADALVIATDVDNAVVGFGTPQARPLGGTTPVRAARTVRALRVRFDGAEGRRRVPLRGGWGVPRRHHQPRPHRRRAVGHRRHRRPPRSRPDPVLIPNFPAEGDQPCPQPSRSARCRSSACPTPPAWPGSSTTA